MTSSIAALVAHDRDTRAVDIGTWLFLASLVMFYGALFSGYVLLRAGSEAWPTPWREGDLGRWPMAVDHWFRTMWLGFAALQARRIRGVGAPAMGLPRFAWLIVAAAAMFVWRSWAVASVLVGLGATPNASVPLACWFVLTGAITVFVAGGAVASAWIAIERVSSVRRARRGAMMERYWLVVLALWLVTVGGLYLG